MLAVLAAASALAMVEPAQAQSFNCNFAKRPSEVAICQSPTLRAKDAERAKEYFELRNGMQENPAWATSPALSRLVRTQTAWLRNH